MIIQDCNGVNPIRLARANGICMRDRLSGSSQGLYCSPCTYSQFPPHAFQHIRRTGRNSGSSGGPGLNYLVELDTRRIGVQIANWLDDIVSSWRGVHHLDIISPHQRSVTAPLSRSTENV